jgi:hypothetical protein
MDAGIIASHIGGCSDMTAVSIGSSSVKSDLASTASCKLAGHTVILDSWATASDVPSRDEFHHLGDSGFYYATGSGWTAILADDGAQPEETTLQMQLTGDATGLLNEARDGDKYPMASIDAQKNLLRQVAAALGGKAQLV